MDNTATNRLPRRTLRDSDAAPAVRADAVCVIDETVYSDGSGVAGVYEVYGQRFSGLHAGEGCEPRVTALGVPSGFRSGRAKALVASGRALVEQRLTTIMAVSR